MTKLFSSGTIEVTPAASAALQTAQVDLMRLLSRHQRGDWGDVDEFRRRMNERAIQNRIPISSVYALGDDTNILIITARDRSRTRVLLKGEYEAREVSTLEGYAVWAGSYDQERNPLIEIEAPYVEAILSDLSIERALDVGTGTGRHALRLAQQGAAVTAVDQSPDMLRVARQAAHDENLAVNFVRASLDAPLPFKSEAFDFLICALVLTHVPDLPGVLHEFYRAMSDGGYLLITDFHPDAVNDRGWRTTFDPEPGVTFLLANMGYTRDDYLAAITDAGFTLLRVFDAPIRELPEEDYPLFVRDFGETRFCLIALAQKPTTKISPEYSPGPDSGSA